MGKGIGDGIPAGTGFHFLGVHTPSLHAGLTASKTALQAGVIRLLRSNRVVLLSVASYCSILCRDVIRLLLSNRELLLSRRELRIGASHSKNGRIATRSASLARTTSSPP
jgi:hypothetical protein